MIQMAERNENPIFSFAKCRILFRKAQIFVSQRTDFISFRVVSQSTKLALCAKAMHFKPYPLTTSTASLSRVNEIKNNQRFDLYSRGIHETMSIKLHPLSLASLSTVHIKYLSNHVIVSKAEELSSRKTDHWFPSDRSITEGKSARFGSRP